MEETYESLETYALDNCVNTQRDFLISIIPLVLEGVISIEGWKMRILESESLVEIITEKIPY